MIFHFLWKLFSVNWGWIFGFCPDEATGSEVESPLLPLKEKFSKWYFYEKYISYFPSISQYICLIVETRISFTSIEGHILEVVASFQDSLKLHHPHIMMSFDSAILKGEWLCHNWGNNCWAIMATIIQLRSNASKPRVDVVVISKEGNINH